MMASMEQSIGIMSKLYGCRRSAVEMLGDNYADQLAMVEDILDAIGEKRGEDRLCAYMWWVKDMKENGVDEPMRVALGAAAVLAEFELTEAE